MLLVKTELIICILFDSDGKLSFSRYIASHTVMRHDAEYYIVHNTYEYMVVDSVSSTLPACDHCIVCFLLQIMRTMWWLIPFPPPCH